jgi:hypothetical protein
MGDAGEVACTSMTRGPGLKELRKVFRERLRKERRD